MTNRLLYALILLLLFSFMSFLLPNVLYPKMAEEKGVSLNTIGIIFALFPVGACLTS
jgi:hypothetical protein